MCVRSGPPSWDACGREIQLVQVAGEAVYTDDVKLSRDALHAALVMSAKPHARLLSVDASKAVQVCHMVCLGALHCRCPDMRAWAVMHGCIWCTQAPSCANMPQCSEPL